MLPAYIFGRRESDPVVEVPHAEVPIVNHVFRRRLNRFYKGKWEAALQEKWILTVTCCILFIGTTVIFILTVFTFNYAEASEESVNLWWKIFTAEKNSGLWPEDPDTGDNELHEWEEELVDLREQITIAKETSTLGIFLGVFTLIANIMGFVALVKENMDLLQWHGVTLGIDELMLMTLAGSLFNSCLRIRGSVSRMTYTYPTKGTCITKLVHYEGKCPVFSTLMLGSKLSALAASLGAVLMAWVAIAYVQLYMTVLIGRQCKPGHDEESFVVTWYKDRLLPHKKEKSRNAVMGFLSDTMKLFRGHTAASDASLSDIEMRDSPHQHHHQMIPEPMDHLSLEIRPPSVALLIQEEITALPSSQGSPNSSIQGSRQFLAVDPAGYHARCQRKKSFTLIPMEDLARVTEALKRKGSLASFSNYPTWEESDELAEDISVTTPLTGKETKTVAIARVHYSPDV